MSRYWIRSTATLVVAALALLAVACSSPAEPTPPPAAPNVACPTGFSGTSLDGNPLVMSYGVPAATGGAPPVSVTCTPASGSSFPVGVTTVTCTAKDSLSRLSTCVFNIQVTSPPRLQVTSFLAFGDSLTEGKPAILYEYEEWPGSYRPYLESLLRSRYVAQVPTVIPAGLGRETTREGLLRLPGDLATYRPEAVLLMEGANDINGGASYIEPAAEAMREMVLLVQASGAVAFVATIPPQREGGFRAKGFPYVEDLNARLRTVAAETGAVLVDVWTAFGGEAPSSLVDVDGLHLTELGYHKVGDTFFDAIRERLEVKTP